jgi:hypothetical protein
MIMMTESQEAPPTALLDAGLLAELHPEMTSILGGGAETAWTDADFASAHASFSADRFLMMPGLLSGADTALVDRYYRRLNQAGLLTLTSPPYPLRLTIADDPVGRALLRQFHPIIEAIAGHSLRQNYSFTAEYQPGAVLPMHTDRAGCEYSISLLIDYDPLPPGGRSTWPLDIASPLHAHPVQFYLARGDALLFKGRELPHGRPPLPQTDRCLVLMLHYVDAVLPDEHMAPG